MEAIKSNVRDFSKRSELFQTISMMLLALLVPLFLGNLIKTYIPAIAGYTQLIVGSTVNACLIITALNLKGWTKNLAVVTMPSLSTILSGYLFTQASTIYMIYMIPAIWVGNFILCYCMKKIVAHDKKNYFLGAILAVVLKVLVIALSFMMLTNLVSIPSAMAIVLKEAMTMTQMYTAIIGSCLAYMVYKLETKRG